MSEYANKRTRGAFIAAVFAMQGFGILVPLYDRVGAGPGRAIRALEERGQPRLVRRRVRLHIRLRQLRAQRDQVHRVPRGDLPGQAPRDVPQDIGGVGEGGRHHWVVRVPVPGAEPGPRRDDARIPVWHQGAELPLRARRLQLREVPACSPSSCRSPRGNSSRKCRARPSTPSRRSGRSRSALRIFLESYSEYDQTHTQHTSHTRYPTHTYG
jgi:hypothetical protein